MPDFPLTLELLDDRTAYRPGEPIVGVAAWNVPNPIRQIEVHLCWHTEGRGTEDVSVVETVFFDNPSPTDAKPFHLTAPIGPYSYEGHLIAIHWAVELVGKGMKDIARLGVIISPSGESFGLPAT